MDIDFVVTWLDSSDPKWQEEFRKYKGITTTADQSKARYRDWDLFRYWFRAVEKYAPWVHKVYLITNGKFPDWINPEHSKLVLVRHSDYIPEQFLPTFNSRTIEFYMNRIKGLSEHFVYFNDDMFINAPITSEYYFKNGLPCDNNAETIINTTRYNLVGKFGISVSLYTNTCVINGHFNRRKVIVKSPRRWFGMHLGFVGVINSLILSFFPRGLFSGFFLRHIEQPYLKSIFDDAWEKEATMLLESSTRFRERATLTPYFFRYWQLASNKFYPKKLNEGRKLMLGVDDISDIEKTLKNSKIKSVCLNDTAYCKENDQELIKTRLHCLFEAKLPQKSKYEK